MKSKTLWLQRAVDRVFEWINPKIGVPTLQQAREANSRWDYAQTNNEAMWDADDNPEALSEAMASRLSNPSLAFGSLLDLAEGGSVIAMNEIGESYYWGRLGVPEDELEAERWYKKAFEAGSLRALLNYGKLLMWRGEYGTAESVFSKGADDDWAPALYWLSITRLHQSRTRKILSEVRPLLERAMVRGHPAAKWRLGRDMAQGRHGLRCVPQGFRTLLSYGRDVMAAWEQRGVPRTTPTGETLH